MEFLLVQSSFHTRANVAGLHSIYWVAQDWMGRALAARDAA